MAFYDDKGEEVRESTRVERLHPECRSLEETLQLDPKDKSVKKAYQKLRHRVTEARAAKLGLHTFLTPAARRITVGELLDALKADYELRGKHSPQFDSHVKRIREHFGPYRAAEVTAEMVDAFIEAQLKNDRKPATVNRGLQLMGQSYKLAVQRRHLTPANVPHIRRLSEADNVRRGFLSEQEFRTVTASLPSYLQDFALFGYLTGWRRGEIASLRWEDVDGDVIRLLPENSKNGEGRTVPVAGELEELIERRQIARKVKTETGVMLASLVFHHNGAPIVDFRKAWASACVMAGQGAFVCPECNRQVDAKRHCEKCDKTWARDDLKYVGRIFHDLRRCAVRSLVRAGNSQDVARSITGHKTASIFSRYNITSEDDKRAAIERTQIYLSKMRSLSAAVQ